MDPLQAGQVSGCRRRVHGRDALGERRDPGDFFGRDAEAGAHADQRILDVVPSGLHRRQHARQRRMNLGRRDPQVVGSVGEALRHCCRTQRDTPRIVEPWQELLGEAEMTGRRAAVPTGIRPGRGQVSHERGRPMGSALGERGLRRHIRVLSVVEHTEHLGDRERQRAACHVVHDRGVRLLTAEHARTQDAPRPSKRRADCADVVAGEAALTADRIEQRRREGRVVRSVVEVLPASRTDQRRRPGYEGRTHHDGNLIQHGNLGRFVHDQVDETASVVACDAEPNCSDDADARGLALRRVPSLPHHPRSEKGGDIVHV